MTQRAVAALARIDARVVLGVMLLLAGLMALESWMLVLRGPFAEFRQIRATHRALELSVRQSPQQLNELGRVASELKMLSDKLRGQLRIPASDDEMAASLMAALDQSASPHGIELSSMKPGTRRQISVFEEVTFEVSGRGNYLQLCQWMLDFEKTLGNSATISDFDMKTADSSGHVTLSFNIALYRPLRLTEESQ